MKEGFKIIHEKGDYRVIYNYDTGEKIKQKLKKTITGKEKWVKVK